MSLRTNLSSLTLSEIEMIRENSNFTDEELGIFDLISKGYTKDEISLKMGMSEATLKRRILNINRKQEKCMGLKEKIPFWQKMNLTVEEAVAYSNIGRKTLENIIRKPNCPFVLYVGKKRLIKRKEFEDFVKKTVEIDTEV